MEKGKGKLIELGKMTRVRRGFTTGANEFFYLDEEAQKRWKIEKEFLKPVIKSPKECETILIDQKKLKFKIFMCNRPKSELKGTNALRYIEWGENQTIEVKSGGDKGKKIKGYHKLETVKNRKYWYDLGDLEKSNFVQGQIFNDRFIFTNSNNTFADCVLNEIVLNKDYKSKIKETEISLNTSITPIFIELFGRSSLGEGALKLQVGEIRKLIITNPTTIKIIKSLQPSREIKSVFSELGINPDKLIREQEPKPLPDRAELDKIVFDELGLTKEERKEVYWAVCELVKQRLEKARSLRD